MFYVKHTCPHLSSFPAFFEHTVPCCYPQPPFCVTEQQTQFLAPVWQAPSCSRVRSEHASQQRDQAAFIRTKQRCRTENSLIDYNLINHPANGHRLCGLLCPAEAQFLCLVSVLAYLFSPVHESGLLERFLCSFPMLLLSLGLAVVYLDVDCIGDCSVYAWQEWPLCGSWRKCSRSTLQTGGWRSSDCLQCCWFSLDKLSSQGSWQSSDLPHHCLISFCSFFFFFWITCYYFIRMSMLSLCVPCVPLVPARARRRCQIA